MACLLVEAGFSGCAVEGHREHGQMINVNDSDWDAPSSVAVTETASVDSPPDGSVVAVAENVAVADPAGTFTEAGTVNAEPLAETDTMTPPAGAGAESVRVQVEEAPASSVVVLHANAEMSTGATRVKLAVWEARFRVAVMVADRVVMIVPTVAVKVAEVALAAMVSKAGTVSEALLSERATTVPLVGAD
jgi:hypothetical protein